MPTQWIRKSHYSDDIWSRIKACNKCALNACDGGSEYNYLVFVIIIAHLSSSLFYRVTQWQICNNWKEDKYLLVLVYMMSKPKKKSKQAVTSHVALLLSTHQFISILKEWLASRQGTQQLSRILPSYYIFTPDTISHKWYHPPFWEHLHMEGTRYIFLLRFLSIWMILSLPSLLAYVPQLPTELRVCTLLKMWDQNERKRTPIPL